VIVHVLIVDDQPAFRRAAAGILACGAAASLPKAEFGPAALMTAWQAAQSA
jgi:hypothetical protein